MNKKPQEKPKQLSNLHPMFEKILKVFMCGYCGSDHGCKCGEYEREEKHNDDFYQNRR